MSLSVAAFIRVVGSEFVQKYLGEGPRMVRDVFRLARENAPSIIFIDEIDAIATKRFDAQTGGTFPVCLYTQCIATFCFSLHCTFICSVMFLVFQATFSYMKSKHLLFPQLKVSCVVHEASLFSAWHPTGRV